MNSSVRYLVFLNLLSILLLSISGAFSGILGRIVYILAFLVPVAIGVLLIKKLGGKCLGITESRMDLKLCLPFAFPTVLIIFLVSLLVSVLLGLFGFEDDSTLSGSLVSVLFTHALMPTVLEEALFRFIPLSMLKGAPRAYGIFYSAFFFAFAHCNLFQIPYALAAGLILAFLDVMFDSIWPSVTIHLLNNTSSILWTFYGGENILAFTMILLSLSLVSLGVIALLYKRHYKPVFADFFKEKSKFSLSSEAVLFLLATLFIAIFSLF